MGWGGSLKVLEGGSNYHQSWKISRLWTCRHHNTSQIICLTLYFVCEEMSHWQVWRRSHYLNAACAHTESPQHRAGLPAQHSAGKGLELWKFWLLVEWGLQFTLKIRFRSWLDARGKGRAVGKQFSSRMTGKTHGPETGGSRAGRENSVVALRHAELEAFMKGTGESSSRPWKLVLEFKKESGPRI